MEEVRAPEIPVPTLVLGVVVSRLFDLGAKGVATVGEVPAGLPPLGLPTIPRGDLGAIAVGGVSLALVALAEGLAATRQFWLLFVLLLVKTGAIAPAELARLRRAPATLRERWGERATVSEGGAGPIRAMRLPFLVAGISGMKTAISPL